MNAVGELPKATIPELTAEEWVLLSAEFDQIDDDRDLMPHVLGAMTGIEYRLIRALLLALGLRGLADNFLYVYHVCTEAPLYARPIADGFQRLPWQCPHCENTILSQAELRYSLVSRLRSRVRFV